MVRKVVIPVAGMGTRFLPATKIVPKEMFPIVDIPNLQLLLMEAVEAGIEEVILVTSDRKEAILKYFETDTDLEEKLLKANKLDLLEKVRNIKGNLKILSVKQEKPLGSANAIYMAKELVGNEPFAVMYGDDLIKGGCALKEMIEIHDKYNCNVIGAQEVPKELVYKYGIISFCDIDTLKISGIVEKPSVEEAPSTCAGLGRYIVYPEIFEEIEKLEPTKNGEYQFTDAMLNLMKRQDFYACKFSGTYYDIGSQLGYIKANIMYALDREELRDKLLEFMSTLVK